jgi:RNA-binding protein 25
MSSPHSRIKWRANRARQLFSENRADTDSRAIDAAEEERVRRESELFLERQMEAMRATQEEQKKAGLLVDDIAPLKISVQVATSKPTEKKVEVMFGQEEDEDAVVKKRRGPLVELDFAMDKGRAAEKLESIRTQVTKDKDTLWKAKVRWEAISDVSSELYILKTT